MLSKNDTNEFPLIDCTPNALIEIRSVGCSLMFFVPFYDKFFDYYLDFDNMFDPETRQ